MSNNILSGINVNSQSGQLNGQERILNYLSASGSGTKDLALIRSKAMDYSNAQIVSSIDINGLQNRNELKQYQSRNLTNITEKMKQLSNREQEIVEEINRLKEEKYDVVRSHEYIKILERVKRYSVNAFFITKCIDDYTNNILNNNYSNYEEEEFINDTTDTLEQLEPGSYQEDVNMSIT